MHNAVVSTEGTYSYAEVRARVREALGVDVTESTLRAGPAEAGRPLSRVTVGMPAPLPGGGRPARFSAGEIDTWLKGHHHRRQADVLAAIRDSPAGSDHREVVARARAEAVSWERIAQALGDAEGRSYSKQAAFKRYGRSAGQNRR